jgi:2-amino-4-hydroxy-6-hydroxymethyldihydropteridine diphosphokinase
VAGATHLYAIAVGSNRPHGRFGGPPQVVEAAIARLDQQFGLFNASPILLNKAMGGAGRDFANAVALIESPLTPQEMLSALKVMERQFGRRRGRRWAARVLDLDIIDWSGRKWSSRRLNVPHKAAATREFVIGPLAAIAPSWCLEPPLTARHLAHRLARRRPRS